MCAIEALPGQSSEAPGDERPRPPAEIDPFALPATRSAIGELRPRSRAAVAGRVTSVTATRWVGGPTVEVVLDDGTGTLLLAFVGRTRLAGVRPGRRLVAAGVVVLRFGHPMLMNPYYWLEAST